jgi:hypothetical protein
MLTPKRSICGTALMVVACSNHAHGADDTGPVALRGSYRQRRAEGRD